MSTAVEMAQRYAIKHCYIDCIPELRPFYATLGFAQSGPAFLHRENGRSYPLPARYRPLRKKDRALERICAAVKGADEP